MIYGCFDLLEWHFHFHGMVFTYQLTLNGVSPVLGGYRYKTAHSISTFGGVLIKQVKSTSLAFRLRRFGMNNVVWKSRGVGGWGGGAGGECTLLADLVRVELRIFNQVSLISQSPALVLDFQLSHDLSATLKDCYPPLVLNMHHSDILPPSSWITGGC